MTTASNAPRLSIGEQAEYLSALLEGGRCWRHGVSNIKPVSLYLDEHDIDVLRELAARLSRMAPHEREIRRIVVGR